MLRCVVLKNELTVVRSMSDIADILSSTGSSLSASEAGSLRSLSASLPPSSCDSKLECKLVVRMCAVISRVVLAADNKCEAVIFIMDYC